MNRWTDVWAKDQEKHRQERDLHPRERTGRHGRQHDPTSHTQVIAVSVLQPLLFSDSDLCLLHFVLLMASRHDVHDEARPEGYMHSHTITRLSC